jgi:3D (Asp-Asp-Asp) domain-containing protein
MRRIFITSFVLLAIITTVVSMLALKVGVGHADNTTLASGVWKGQGSFVNGQTGFPMTLTLTVNGTTFTGDLVEATLNSEAKMDGSVSSTMGNSVGITFVPSQIVSGDQIQLGSIYSATFSGGRISGNWTLSGHTTADGNFTLDPVPPVTPTVVPPQPPTQPQPTAPNQPLTPTPPTAPNQPPTPTPPTAPNQPLTPTPPSAPNQPPTPTPPPAPNQPPAPSPTPTDPPHYVPSGNGQTANVRAAITWYGFDNNPSSANPQGSAAILYPQSANNPTLHNTATEGTGTFNDPITFATRVDDQQTFPIGSVIYVPMTQKYYIMEDACNAAKQQSCAKGDHQVQLWMGPPQAGGNALMNCENKNTPASSLDVVLNPSPSMQVDTTPEFSNGQCTLHTY